MTVRELMKLMGEIPESMRDLPAETSIMLDDEDTRIDIVSIQYGFDEETSDLFVSLMTSMNERFYTQE